MTLYNCLYKYRNEKGTTMIELLLYMAIFSLFLLVLTDIFSQVIDVELESQGISNVEEDGKFIALRLTHDIQSASAITAPANPGDTSGSLQLAVNGVNYTYSINSNNLVLTEGATTAQLNGYSTTISTLTFKRLGNTGGKNAITVNFTVTDAAQRVAGQAKNSYQVTASMR